MKHEKIKPLFIWIAVILVFGSLAVTNAQTSLQNQNGQQTPQNNVTQLIISGTVIPKMFAAEMPAKGIIAAVSTAIG